MNSKMILAGFALEWPTFVMVVIFPILVFIYVRLAKSEEQDVLVEFGETFRADQSRTPSSFPRLEGKVSKEATP